MININTAPKLAKVFINIASTDRISIEAKKIRKDHLLLNVLEYFKKGIKAKSIQALGQGADMFHKKSLEVDDEYLQEAHKIMVWVIKNFAKEFAKKRPNFIELAILNIVAQETMKEVKLV